MNIQNNHGIQISMKYTFAIILVAAYLVMPTTIFAYASILTTGTPSTQTTRLAADANAPCDSCPCSDEQDSGCCESTSCNCACHAPLASTLRITYAPLIVTENFYESTCSLPQVYLHIFVPPQNIPVTQR